MADIGVGTETHGDDDAVAKRRAYFKDWYGRNREDISRRRRERYVSDSEYRKKIKDRSSRASHGRRMGRRVRCFHGPHGDVCLISIRCFADMIGRGIQTIRRWHRSGALPPTPFITDTGIAYYTPAMAKVVVGVLGAAEYRQSHEEFRRKVEDGWRAAEIPVGVETLEEALKMYRGEEIPESMIGPNACCICHQDG